MSDVVQESDMAGENGRTKGGEQQDAARGLSKQGGFVSPVPLEQSTEPIPYRDDGTGASGGICCL